MTLTRRALQPPAADVVTGTATNGICSPRTDRLTLVGRVVPNALALVACALASEIIVPDPKAWRGFAPARRDVTQTLTFLVKLRPVKAAREPRDHTHGPLCEPAALAETGVRVNLGLLSAGNRGPRRHVGSFSLANKAAILRLVFAPWRSRVRLRAERNDSQGHPEPACGELVEPVERMSLSNG
jgi:hypothetical protein